MNKTVVSVISWLISLWTVKVFLSSLPYKFSNHPDTQHIFSTIGEWIKGILGNGIGQGFIDVGAYVVGSVELIVSIILLAPVVAWLLVKASVLEDKPYRALLHCLGGLFAAGVMAGAVFFHLFTPLGWEVLHEGKSDGGSLATAALSILVLGLIMFVANFLLLRNDKQNQFA